MFALKFRRAAAVVVAFFCIALSAVEDLPRAAVILLALVAGALVALLAVGAEDLPALRPAGLAPTRRGAVTTEGGA